MILSSVVEAPAAFAAEEGVVDAEVIRWANDRRFPWYYTREAPCPGRLLKVHCGCVTAYFQCGELLRLRADAQTELFEVMFRELTGLFALRSSREAADAVDRPAPHHGASPAG